MAFQLITRTICKYLLYKAHQYPANSCFPPSQVFGHHEVFKHHQTIRRETIILKFIDDCGRIKKLAGNFY
jgi:hypothetical protein